MSGFENRLLNFEITPPAGAWENISRRLDEEFRDDEQKLAEKFLNAEAAPPQSLWDNITEALHEKDIQPSRPAVIRKIFPRRIAIAAILIGIVAIGTVYFLNSSNTAKKLVTVNPPVITRDTQSQTSTDIPSPAAALSQIVVPKVPVIRAKNSNSPTHKTGTTEDKYNNDVEIRYARASPALAGNTLNTAKVSAPLIRDANGRVILDRTLLTSPGNDYITITGPNGEQTKISSKFLSVLTDLNDESTKDDYFDFFFQGSSWKSRFQEWRNKLLQSAGFAPTATNFFDIVELKDLLEEN